MGEPGAFEIICYSCGAKLRMGDRHRGKTGACPQCHAPIAIPANEPITDRQSEYLLNLGANPTVITNLTKHQASGMIDVLVTLRDNPDLSDTPAFHHQLQPSPTAAHNKKPSNACLPIAIAIVVFCMIVIVLGTTKGCKVKNRPSILAKIEIKPTIIYDGVRFAITNNDSFDWTNVTLAIEHRPESEGRFTFRTAIIRAGETKSIGAEQFVLPSGRRFSTTSELDPFFFINCETPGGRGYRYKHLEAPAPASVPTPVSFIEPQHLVTGASYRIVEKTPLMPFFEPPADRSDPMAAIGKVIYLPPGSSFYVREERTKRAIPWYYVGAVIAETNQRAEGWINSTALMGQDLEEVE